MKLTFSVLWVLLVTIFQLFSDEANPEYENAPKKDNIATVFAGINHTFVNFHKNLSIFRNNKSSNELTGDGYEFGISNGFKLFQVEKEHTHYYTLKMNYKNLSTHTNFFHDSSFNKIITDDNGNIIDEKIFPLKVENNLIFKFEELDFGIDYLIIAKNFSYSFGLELGFLGISEFKEVSDVVSPLEYQFSKDDFNADIRDNVILYENNRKAMIDFNTDNFNSYIINWNIGFAYNLKISSDYSIFFRFGYFSSFSSLIKGEDVITKSFTFDIGLLLK